MVHSSLDQLPSLIMKEASKFCSCMFLGREINSKRHKQDLCYLLSPHLDEIIHSNDENVDSFRSFLLLPTLPHIIDTASCQGPVHQERSKIRKSFTIERRCLELFRKQLKMNHRCKKGETGSIDARRSLLRDWRRSTIDKGICRLIEKRNRR